MRDISLSLTLSLSLSCSSFHTCIHPLEHTHAHTHSMHTHTHTHNMHTHTRTFLACPSQPHKTQTVLFVSTLLKPDFRFCLVFGFDKNFRIATFFFSPEKMSDPLSVELTFPKTGIFLELLSSTFLNRAFLYLSCCQMARQGFFPYSNVAA